MAHMIWDIQVRVKEVRTKISLPRRVTGNGWKRSSALSQYQSSSIGKSIGHCGSFFGTVWSARTFGSSCLLGSISVACDFVACEVAALVDSFWGGISAEHWGSSTIFHEHSPWTIINPSFFIHEHTWRPVGLLVAAQNPVQIFCWTGALSNGLNYFLSRVYVEGSSWKWTTTSESEWLFLNDSKLTVSKSEWYKKKLNGRFEWFWYGSRVK